MGNFKLKNWEKGLIGVAIALFIFSVVVFLTDLPIRKYLFGVDEVSGQMRVGELSHMSGSIRRQIDGESEFKGIQEKDPLYNMDVLVSGDESGATLALDDETTVEMSPKTMLRLTFRDRFSENSISRSPKIEVFSGKLNVKTAKKKLTVVNQNEILEVLPNSKKIAVSKTTDVQAAIAKLTEEKKNIPEVSKPLPTEMQAATPLAPPMPTALPVLARPSPSPTPTPAITPTPSPSPSPTPTPTPSPTREGILIEHASATVDDTCVNDPNTQLPKKSFSLDWAFSKQKAIILTVMGPNDTVETPVNEIMRKRFEAKDNKAVIDAPNPGRFQWKIQAVDRKTVLKGISNGEVMIGPNCLGINILPPLVGGVAKENTNKLTTSLRSQFDVTFQWDPLPKATRYHIVVSKSNTLDSPLVDKDLLGNKYSFNKNHIFVGQIYYRVTSLLSNRYLVSSATADFFFSFLPPDLVKPSDQDVIRVAKIKRDRNTILMTWTKTNYTQGYEIEISRTPHFSSSIVKKALKDNFYIFANPIPGQYWWRARSFTQDASSEMSKPFTFIVAP